MAKKSKALVVYTPPKTRALVAPKKKKKTKTAPKNGGLARMDLEVRKYMAALTDPFSERACGARVPDQYSCHTTTFELRATHSVQSVGGTIGVWVLPNVVTSLVVPDGTFTGSSTITWLDGTTTPTVRRWGFDSTTLGNKLQNYRVVGMGVRVTNLSSMTNAAGKLIMGTYPINAYYATADFNIGGNAPAVNTGGTGSNTLSKWGVPFSGGTVDYASLVNYPGTKVVSALEAAEGEYDIIPKPCQPSAFEFREPNDSYQGFNFPGMLSGTSRAAGDASYLKLDGFEAAFVGMTGGSGINNTLDIEIVYHIEGAPIIVAGTPSAAFINQQGTASPVNISGFFGALESALKLPGVRKVVHTAADMAHPLLGKFARAIL